MSWFRLQTGTKFGCWVLVADRNQLKIKKRLRVYMSRFYIFENICGQRTLQAKPLRPKDIAGEALRPKDIAAKPCPYSTTVSLSMFVLNRLCSGILPVLTIKSPEAISFLSLRSIARSSIVSSVELNLS
jgi:hypothetical protein